MRHTALRMSIRSPLTRIAFGVGTGTVVLAASVAPAGAQVSPTPTAAQVAMPSVVLPAALDRVLRDYERAWGAGDVKALVALFTEDGFVLQPGRAPARGHAALTAVYTGQGGGPLRLRPLAFATADTIGYIIGAYRYGEESNDQGKFTLTLRMGNNGRWLIASDMDNDIRPASRPPAR